MNPSNKTTASDWIEQHGTALVLFMIVMIVCVNTHMLGRAKATIFKGKFLLWDDCAAAEVNLIHYVHAHWWIAIPYGIFVASCLGWLEIRNAPRWTVWVSFLLLSLPAIAYARACAHIFFKIAW